jgi:hypothetical protein
MISKATLTRSAIITLAGFFMGMANADIITPTIAYGHNNRDNFGGNITDVYNGSGMNGYNSPGADDPSSLPPGWPTGYGDPSTWNSLAPHHSGSGNGPGQYRDEWQADHMLDVNASINNKMGWIILDLGAPTADLENMYLWNGIQIGTGAMKDFNLYHSTAPVVPATQGPTGGNDADDYDFGVPAWTQVGGTETLSDGGGAGLADGVYALGGVTARYVGIEMLNRHNGNTDPTSGRIGFAEVGFTTSSAIPEPNSLALLGLGFVALIAARRRLA